MVHEYNYGRVFWAVKAIVRIMIFKLESLGKRMGKLACFYRNY